MVAFQSYPWRPDGTGVQPSGDVGGDEQRGESYSICLVRPDKPCSIITITYWAAENEKEPGEYLVVREVEWLICRDPADPGGTEEWSEYARDDLYDDYGCVFNDEGKAEQHARQYAAGDLTAPEDYYGWDGEPSW